MDYSEGDPMLRCSECKQLFHWDCVNCLKLKPLKGDCFYKFTCKICNGDEEERYERDMVSWVQVIYLVLFHLIKSEPDKKYFRWRENICATIDENWNGLFPGKSKTATWHNTVAGSLSTHSLLFKSGFEDTQQTGNWTLHQVVDPSEARFRAPTKARNSEKSAAKHERGRKKDGTGASAKKVTDAEKEILEVLNESKTAGRQRRGATRHHVSFSDDEEEDGDVKGSSGKRSRTKKRRIGSKTPEMDDDLLQSFAIYSKMEKQRLGQHNGDAVTAAGDSTKNVESKDAVVPATGSKEDDDDDERPSESDAKGADVVELLDDCYLGDDVESISSLSSWSTDAGLEDSMDIDMAPPAMTSSSKRSPTKRTESNMLVRGLADKGENVAVVRKIVGAEDVTIKSPYIGREREKEEVIGWTRLLEAEEEDYNDDEALTSALFSNKREILSERAQWDVSAQISSSKVAMSSPHARRLHRKLQLWRFKRMLGIRTFDIDSTVKECMYRSQRAWNADVGRDDVKALGNTKSSGHAANQNSALSDDLTTADTKTREDIVTSSYDDISGGSSRVSASTLRIQEQEVPSELDNANECGGEVVSITPYAHSFASRLLGRAVLRDSLTSPVARVSPYHGRLLRPFIWRDWVKKDNSERKPGTLDPAALWIRRDIRSQRHRIFGKLGAAPAEASACGNESIDYVYFQEEHVEQVNALLARTFWGGVDVREALMYPEFTIVALYRRLVIGCAFLTPDAYLTYIAVSAGWEGAGIARFMLHHLTQTLPTKDVTLHVSANNVAMLLYQQFGFKPEKYVVDFYKSYLPESSRLSANAFFMRLRRY
ncbi:hypothetical protein EV175_004785 [Coemansia sp. RSA 1933]|nr:hypothetical protein EV175_004785 [Coemansia sp. RSA 1933]